MFRKLVLLGAPVALAIASLMAPPQAVANTVNVSWFTVAAGTPDFQGNQCCGVYSNEVLAALGPDGLPVVNTTTSDNPFTLSDVNAAKELQWWTPGNGVTATGSSMLNVPVSQNMFIPNGTGNNDGSGFQTAIMRGTLTVGSGGGTITFGGDDDMFVALNGTIWGQVGGVHAPGPTDTFSVGQGVYALEVFYADRQQVQAFADFSITGGTVTGVPEPSTWAMLVLGFAGLGFAGYRRNKARVSFAAA